MKPDYKGQLVMKDRNSNEGNVFEILSDIERREEKLKKFGNILKKYVPLFLLAIIVMVVIYAMFT